MGCTENKKAEWVICWHGVALLPVAVHARDHPLLKWEKCQREGGRLANNQILHVQAPPVVDFAPDALIVIACEEPCIPASSICDISRNKQDMKFSWQISKRVFCWKLKAGKRLVRNWRERISLFCQVYAVFQIRQNSRIFQLITYFTLRKPVRRSNKEIPESQLVAILGNWRSSCECITRLITAVEQVSALNILPLVNTHDATTK